MKTYTAIWAMLRVALSVANFVTCTGSCVAPSKMTDPIDIANYANENPISLIPKASPSPCIVSSVVTLCPVGMSTPSPHDSPSSIVADTAPHERVNAESGPCTETRPCTGDMTFYDTATSTTNPSSCGTVNDGNVQNVLAISQSIMSEEDCGKTVVVEYDGKTATGTIVDKCSGCDSTSIDVSRHLFGSLALLTQGRIPGVRWYIV